MPKPLKLSHTSLDIYQKCGYKYFLKYRKYIKPYIPIRWPLVSGVAFHSLADLMYKTLDFSRKFLIRNWRPIFIEALDNESCTLYPIVGWDKQLKYGYYFGALDEKTGEKYRLREVNNF